MPSQPLILEIQRELITGTADVVSSLRKSLVAARKLELREFSKWIDQELKGYSGVIAADLPRYRIVPTSPRFRNPYYGWFPIIIEDEALRELTGKFPGFQPVGELQDLIRRSEEPTVRYIPELENILRRSLDVPLEIRGFIPKTSLLGIIDAVKNALLEWTLELEGAGVVGDGMSFSESEKAEAAPVTQNFYAENIGHIGNVSGRGRVGNRQSSGSRLAIDQVAEVASQVEAALPKLPDTARQSAKHELDLIKREIASKQPSASRIHAALRSLKAIGEGAAGNLSADGIATLIGRLLA